MIKDKITNYKKTYDFNIRVTLKEGCGIMAHSKADALKNLKAYVEEEFGKDAKFEYELFDINFAG